MSKLHDELKVRLNGWDWFVFVVALGSLLLVLVETFLNFSAPTMVVFRWIDNAACGVFFIDVMVRWRRAGWAAEFWRWGWVDLLAAIPFDSAFRTLQIIRVYRIIRVLRVLYKLQELTTGTTLNERLLALPGMAVVMIIFSTALMVEAERHAVGATIKSGGDALWWALTTVTTVGYGDMYPVTTEGRIIAAGLMLVGIALFGSISAIVTSKLILPKETKDHEELRREIRSLHADIRDLREELRKK
jgi:voltage-gated potassium channel